MDSKKFFPEWEKENMIAFMPRKLADQAALVILGLGSRIGRNWSWKVIDNLPERSVIEILKRSKIFLSFSYMEGLGLPPLEAALCGNYVVGYHGEGGREYWKRPNFEEVNPGDIASFIDRVETLANRIAAGDAATGDLISNITYLRDKFSPENELRYLKSFANKVASLF